MTAVYFVSFFLIPYTTLFKDSCLLCRGFLSEARPGGGGGKCSLAPALRHCFLGPCLSAWLPRPVTRLYARTHIHIHVTVYDQAC